MSKSPVPQEHIVSTEFEGGEGVLVDLDTTKYYQLNETAMLVWRCLEKGLTPAEIVSEITSVYEVTSEHAAGSLHKILEHLQSHKLLKPSA